MLSASVTLIAALLGGLVLTPLARGAARYCGVVDQPDGRRKLQRTPIPLWGGVALFLALLMGVVVASLFGLPGNPALLPLAQVLVLAAGLVCVLGCVDDSVDLKPRVKLLLQTASTVPVVLAGYWVHRIALFGWSIELGWAGAALTVLWLVGCINAINLLDGMDGLASTVGLLLALVIALVAAVGGHPHVALIAVALAGALAGFLVYNLPPASIYLGDSGSMVIGLVIGVLALHGSLGTSSALSIAVPAVIMTVPLLDAALAVARRRLSGRPFDAADRGHIHHRLLARGLSKWQTLGVIGTLCLVTGAAATAATVLHSEVVAWVTAGGVVVLLVTTRAFGNYEHALMKLAVAHTVSRCLRRLADSRRAGRSTVRRSALGGMPFDDAWNLLIGEVKRWQARRLELVVTSDHKQQAHRKVWTDQTEPPLSCVEWSLAMTFAGPAGRTCHLHASGVDAGVSQQWALVQLMRVLKPFGEHWTVRPDGITSGTLPLQVSPSPALPGQPPSQSTRQAA